MTSIKAMSGPIPVSFASPLERQPAVKLVLDGGGLFVFLSETGAHNLS